MSYPQLAVMNISHRYFDLEEFFSSAAASGYTCCELWTGAMHLYVDCHGYDSLEQVQELVNYAKYYPIGQRGFCPSRKDGWGFDGLGSVPETMRHFNGETLLFPQCETAEALGIIEDICAVDGVDGIFVGPFDLSISMGMPGQFDAPEFQAAITRIVAACHAAGKYCMFFTGTADGVVDGFRRGFDAMAYSLDAALFIQGVKRDVEDIRSRLQ